MKNKIQQYITLVLKGFAMGAANVIPGVSGGTIALITGVFERLINAIKSFDINAIKLLFKWKIKELIEYVDLYFLIAVFSGMIVSVVSLAKLLEFLFTNYPVLVWAFFFGLILASVYYVGKTIKKWSISVILTFIFGTSIAVVISMLNPATQNDSFFYLIICGIIAICSMILPGLSGSFILILLGNYELVMIQSVSTFDLAILFPVIIGVIVGLIAFSHILSWIYKKYKDQTISILTGFILGSLSILWPWKNEVYRLDSIGNFILKDGERIIQGYTKYIPETINIEVILAISLMITGFITIYLIEKLAGTQEQ
jgi:putative membrane protein